MRLHQVSLSAVTVFATAWMCTLGTVPAVLPAAALTYLATAILARDWHRLTGLERLSSAPLLNFLLGRAYELAWKSTLVLLAWAGLDYFVERHRLEQDLRMSRQDRRSLVRRVEAELGAGGAA